MGQQPEIGGFLKLATQNPGKKRGRGSIPEGRASRDRHPGCRANSGLWETPLREHDRLLSTPAPQPNHVDGAPSAFTPQVPGLPVNSFNVFPFRSSVE